MVSHLCKLYNKTGSVMPYTREDFEKENKRLVLESLTLEERLEGLSEEELLQRVSKKKHLEKLPLEELSKEELQELRVNYPVLKGQA